MALLSGPSQQPSLLEGVQPDVATEVDTDTVAMPQTGYAPASTVQQAPQPPPCKKKSCGALA